MSYTKLNPNIVKNVINEMPDDVQEEAKMNSVLVDHVIRGVLCHMSSLMVEDNNINGKMMEKYADLVWREFLD